MKKILLINNQSLNYEKFIKQNQLLFDAAKELNCELDIKTNCEIICKLNDNSLLQYDGILFYDKDIYLAKTLERLGLKVFNSSDAIAICDNKALTTLALEKANLPIPKTSIIPLIFYYNRDYYNDYVDNLIKELKLPMICKEWFGSWGEQVYLLKSKQDIFDLIDKKQGKELLFQEFIAECSGQDIRINIVGNQIVACMKRKSHNGDFRANISNGGTMEAYTPTTDEINIALKACESVGCDFCGVDILQSKTGPLVCEINSNAHLLNIYKCTGTNVGKEILKYILNKISKEK